MSRRGWLIAALVLLLALVSGLLGRGRSDGGPPFDPRSTEPSGSAGLVEVLRELGADVQVGRDVPDESVDVFVLLVGGRDGATTDGIEGWVRAGGRLILADPSSPLNPAEIQEAAGFELFGSVPLPVACDHPALDDLDRVASTSWTALEAPPSASLTCLPIDDGVALFTQPLDEGELVVFGGRGAWTNDRLAEAHNAALVAALVQPTEGTRVVVAAPRPPGAGDRRLTDLVPDRIRMALWQLVVAFGLLAWARSRRHGRPVEEELPTQVRGSEMVAAIGGLLERTGSRDAVARTLQEDLARQLRDLLGLPADTSRETLMEVASDRTGIDGAALRAALEEPRIGDDRQLVAVTRSIAGVRHRLDPVAWRSGDATMDR